MTERECLLEAARFISTDGAELRGDPEEMAATLRRMADSRDPGKLLDVFVRHASSLGIGTAGEIARAVGYRLAVSVVDEKERGLSPWNM